MSIRLKGLILILAFALTAFVCYRIVEAKKEEEHKKFENSVVEFQKKIDEYESKVDILYGQWYSEDNITYSFDEESRSRDPITLYVTRSIKMNAYNEDMSRNDSAICDLFGISETHYAREFIEEFGFPPAIFYEIPTFSAPSDEGIEFPEIPKDYLFEIQASFDKWGKYEIDTSIYITEISDDNMIIKNKDNEEFFFYRMKEGSYDEE